MTADDKDFRAESAAPGQVRRPASVVERATAMGSGAGRDRLLECLVRITARFGKPLNALEIRNICPIPPSGMTVETFLRAGQRLGYRVAQAPFEAGALDSLPTPFVVVAGEAGEPTVAVLERQADGYRVFDPVRAATDTLPAAALGGKGARVILIRPAAEPEKAVTWRAMLTRRIGAVLWELALASMVINIFALASPFFIMTIYNKVVGQRALDTLDVLAIGMITIYAFDLLLRMVRGYVAAHTGARVEAMIGGEVVHHLLHLPYIHFEATPSGLITERVRQLDTIRAFFTGQMPLVIADLLFVSLFLIALFAISPLLGFIVLAVMPVFILISAAFHQRQRRLNEQNFLGQAAKASALNETVANALTVKGLGLESEIERRWNHRLGLSAWTGFRLNNMVNIVGVSGHVVQQFTALAIIYFGARLIIAGDLTIGALIASNILATRALAPMRQIVSAWHQVQEVRAAFTRIDAIMSEPVEHQPGELGAGAPIKGDIALEGVRFRYGQDNPLVLDGVDLSVKSGEIIGIIGPFGSGKSTLAKLLQGLYKPESGRVLIDDNDIQHLSPAALRQQIGFVPQEVQLFAGTVRENIAMGTTDPEPERVVAVAKFVGAHDFIQFMAKGYDTVLTERGGSLSAGQRQMLAIARALVRNPRLIILDEATSALDPAAEDRLMVNLRQASRGRTIVLISHRMSPLQYADRVAVLIDGRIQRQGPPQEMIAYLHSRTSASEGQQA